jgi:hypothetical protein
VLEATTTSTKKFRITTKHAAAQILRDTEFNTAEGARVHFDCALNPHKKYAKDTKFLSSHSGWNLLSEEFVGWYQQEEAPEDTPAPSQLPAPVCGGDLVALVA